MKKICLLFATLSALINTEVFILVGAIENIGGNICNTNENQVLVKELTKSEDSTLFAFQDQVAASRERFVIGNTPGGKRRALLKFLLNDYGIPSDAKVECAEIRLIPFYSDEQVPEIKLHEVTSEWTTTGQITLSPSLGGGSADNGDTTWRFAIFPSTEWKNYGGDYDPSVLSKVKAGTEHWFGDTPELTRVVQGWIDGTSMNNGFLLIGPEDEIVSYKLSYTTYNGMESAPDLIPRLILTYTSPSEGKPHRTSLEQEKKSLDIVFILLAVFGATFIIATVVAYTYRQQRKSVANDGNLN